MKIRRVKSRGLLLLLSLSGAQGAFAATAEVSAAFSMPRGLEASYRQPLGAESPWAMEVGIGGLPLERLWPGALVRSSELSEVYATDIAPRLFLLTSAVRMLYRARPEASWTWSAGLEFWSLQGGALVFLKNRDTNESALMAELQVRWWQPVLHAGASWNFARSETSRWDLELGLALLFGGRLGTQFQGPLPSLQKVAPEYAHAIEDGSAAAEQNLSSSLEDALSAWPVLPNIGVRYSW